MYTGKLGFHGEWDRREGVFVVQEQPDNMGFGAHAAGVYPVTE